MIGRKNRFHGYGSLKRAYQHGQTARGSLLSLRYVDRQAAKPYRVAVVVSKKVSKSAVVRNQIRRRVYEVVRLADDVPPRTDLVFTVFSEQVAELPVDTLRANVDQLLKKITTPRSGD